MRAPESISVNASGELVVETKWGEVVERKPVIYQIENGSRVAVEGEYSLKGTSAFGFELHDYNTVLPLVIDPVLSYSTYLGGSDSDRCYGIAVDASGAAYVTGYTYSSDFPTENAWDDSHNGYWDVFVTKFSAAGNSLLYSTFLGGSDWEGDESFSHKGGIAVDGSGCAYVTGGTHSSDFPTENAWDDSFNGGYYDVDAFVTKFSAAGNTLLYSTFLGGIGSVMGNAIAVDSSGCAYLAGATGSSDFPTKDAWDDSFNGSNADAFVTKFSAAGNSLLYSTFLGGSDWDCGYGVAIDGAGCAYVTGRTQALNFPTVNAWDDSHNGNGDAFVTKFCDISQSCCIPPSVGDLDQGGGDLGFNYDGADLSAMINGLFIDPTNGWDGICLDEADVDFTSERPVVDPMTVDGADLSLLIDALFIAPTHFLKNCDGTDNW